VIIVHYVAKTAGETAGITPVARKVLEAAEPIPPGAVWLDMVEPTASEDQKVELFLGCKVPSRADPDFTEPQRTGRHARRYRRHLRSDAGHAGHCAL
jgi:magnesium transporter